MSMRARLCSTAAHATAERQSQPATATGGGSVLSTSRLATLPFGMEPLYQSGTCVPVLAAAWREPGFARLNPPPRRARLDLRARARVPLEYTA